MPVASPHVALAQRGRGALAERLREQAKDQESGSRLDEERARNQPPRPNPADPAIAAWLNQLAKLIPTDATGFADMNVDEYRKAIDATERWAAELVRFDNSPRPNEMLLACNALLNAKDRVDRQLEQTLAIRTGFAAHRQI